MVSVFLAPCRQPVMHSPHWMHPVRSGPAPPKNGSGTVAPGSCAPSRPKNTPTGVGWKVSALPNCSASRFISRSLGVVVGLVTTPSIFLACA